MSDKFPFNKVDVNLSSPQSKIVMRRSSRQFNADMLFLAYEAPSALGDEAQLAYGSLEATLQTMSALAQEMTKYRKDSEARLKAKSCRILEYDEDATETFALRIHCAPAKMFIQMIIELEKTAPLVETMAYHAMITIPERNRKMRDLKKQLVSLAQELNERRNTIEKTLSEIRKKNYNHKSFAPTGTEDVKAIKIRRRPHETAT